MARPRVRTSSLAEGEVREIREMFGTVTNAYARLMPGGSPLSWKVFSEAAGGRPVRPEHADALRKTVAEWRRANLRRGA